MKELAIRVEGLGKQYSIGGPQKQYDTLRDTVTETALRPVRALQSLWDRNGKPSGGVDTIWALKDVSFEVKRGEVVGVIGRNGAGKSTLLKILSRITEPTEGWVDLCGRVGSLLEVGTGFHPELTGRENIFLNGAILGMKRAEIARKFDEIVAFAEVEKFIDTPVKHYSSGMYLRLAFAVAAHLEPEILLVDEVLAVGDGAFQKKCLGKMSTVASEGRTILFVSHDMTNVSVLCDSAILLEAGCIKAMGPPSDVISAHVHQQTRQQCGVAWDLGNAPGDDLVRILSVHAGEDERDVQDSFPLQEPIPLLVEFVVLGQELRLNPVFVVKTALGVTAFSTANYEDRKWAARVYGPGRYRAKCIIPGHILNDGKYFVDALVVQEMRAVRAAAEGAISFEIYDDGTTRGDYVGPWVGAVRPRCRWEMELVPPRPGRSDPRVSARAD